MRRLILSIFTCGLLCMGLVAATPAAAEEEAKPKGPPQVASDEEVIEALARFKEEFKARGIPKDEVVGQRNYAMKNLAELQHPAVVDTLAKITKHRNKDLRTLALIYLGDQTLFPAMAAKPILAAMKKHKRERGMVMTGLQSLCLLKYLGARKEIIALLKHKDVAVKKLAISTVGAIKDMRLLKEILRLLGVDVDATSSQKDGSGGVDSGDSGGANAGSDAPSGGKESGGDSGSGEGDGGEEGEGGYSWDGVDVFVPEGEDPEAAVRAAQEKNRSAAEAAARGKGGGGGGAAPATAAPSSKAPASSAPSGGSSPSGSSGLGSGGSSRGSGAQQRGAAELVPTILVTLKELTGVKFSEPGSIKEWVTKNATAIQKRQRELDKEEKAQEAAAAVDEKNVKLATKSK